MIVRDEEKNLEKYLLQVKNLVDEIIIIDTGSIDNTKKIALSFTDMVFDFKWCNDFSVARNFSISKATNDWILVLDADEFIESFDKAKVLEFISSKDNMKTVGRIKRINLIEDQLGIKKGTELISRLFNRKYFRYEGTIHEQIAHRDGEVYSIKPVDITVNHIGYTKEEVDRTNKLERNISLLKKAIEEKSNEPYLYYQLGKSFYMMKDYIEAYKCFEKAISFPVDCRLEYVEDLIETYGYALINAEKFGEAMEIQIYREYYNSADYNFLMGLIYMNNAKFDLAVQSFLKCNEYDDGKMEGISTYLPYYNIGVIFECLGYRDEAISYYRKCGNYDLAVTRLKSVLN
ncbi:glycosyltransferase [Clostridium saccharobutylicum]|nr:glycosyltransferase [Clostridium saccharobutylicum]MBA8894789.1 hypothetical protein [Clostridium saccharobutylicum]MBA8984306.1 hypothetical protein [Clostridium saccharobutylicum]MBA8997125.1 hypothetical protein [Clostridium saccharobutylicum]MBA9008559.1 hypothetical protein [Clostridium saccharobutylicum]NOV55287.1 hypothetical protein [Clostridium saccharobutylicum]